MELDLSMLIPTLGFLAIIIIIVSPKYFIGFKLKPKSSHPNLPPGTSGWPLLGESIEFIKANMEGHPEKFVADRVERYRSSVFRTSLFGAPTVVLCGPEGNKFIFSNEDKLEMWWPPSLKRLIRSSWLTKTGHQAKAIKKHLISGFFNIEFLVKCIPSIDEVIHNHLKEHWEGKEEVQGYATVKLGNLSVTCKLFMNKTERDFIARLAHELDVLDKGILQLPFNIPRTQFHCAMMAAEKIRSELRLVLRERAKAREEKQETSTDQNNDIMSLLISTKDEDGNSLPEEEVINNIIGLLFSGNDSSTGTICLVMKCLADKPRAREMILREQREIAMSKEPGELLNWKDVQKMKYSWSVVCEVMRVNSPVVGFFREATECLEFEGYTIPKGWNVLSSIPYTHQDPSCFPKAKDFDELRFLEDSRPPPPPFSYVPFGRGWRTCLGKELARVTMLVYLHNLVNRISWEVAVPNEKWKYEPLIKPVNGLPLRVRPY